MVCVAAKAPSPPLTAGCTGFQVPAHPINVPPRNWGDPRAPSALLVQREGRPMSERGGGCPGVGSPKTPQEGDCRVSRREPWEGEEMRCSWGRALQAAPTSRQRPRRGAQQRRRAAPWRRGRALLAPDSLRVFRVQSPVAAAVGLDGGRGQSGKCENGARESKRRRQLSEPFSAAASSPPNC